MYDGGSLQGILRIHVARDGAEGLEFIFGASTAPRPQVIRLDLKLPKVDGLEVLRRLKADPRTHMTPRAFWDVKHLLVYMAEQYNKKILSRHRACSSPLQSLQAQLAQVRDYLSTSTIG